MWCGYSFVFIGLAFLAHNLGILPYGAWDYIWPSLLIIWGIGIIRGRPGFWCVPSPGESESRPGGETNSGLTRNS